MEHLISSAIVAVAFQLGPSTFAASSSREVWQVTVLANGVKLYYPVESLFVRKIAPKTSRSRDGRIFRQSARMRGNSQRS